MAKVLQKVLFLHFLQLFSMVFYLIRAFVREMFVFLLQFLLVFLLLSFIVFLLSLMIGRQKVLFHEFLNHFLPHMILFKLIRDKLAELLLLHELNMPIKVLETALHLDLLHVQIKHLLVVHLVVAHEHTLPELLVKVRRVNHTHTRYLRCLRCRGSQISSLSNTFEFRLTLLRIRVGLVDIASS